MRTPKYRKHSTRDKGFAVLEGKRIYFPGHFKSAESLEAYGRFLGEHFSSKNNNNAKGNAEAISAASAAEPDEPPVSIAGFMDRYLDHAKTYYPEGTQGEFTVIRSAVRLFVDHSGHLDLEGFGAPELKKWRTALIEMDQSRNYINQCIRKIKRAFRWGLEEGLVPELTVFSVTSLEGLKKKRSKARETKKRKPVPMEWFNDVVKEVPPQIADMMNLQLLVGVRPGSICKAKPEQFDNDPNDKELMLWRLRHKTEDGLDESGDVELILPIGPKAQKIIGPYLAKTATNKHLFNPRNTINSRRYNDYYVTRTYQQAIDRAIEKINKQRAKDKEDGKADVALMPHWTPHQIRHARGHDVREKYDVESAQAVLGHKSLKSTEIYSARKLSLAKQVAKETG